MIRELQHRHGKNPEPEPAGISANAYRFRLKRNRTALFFAAIIVHGATRAGQTVGSVPEGSV
ncbi:hypothetical protein [Bradyrhizobium centrolobii]|uniref:hypothetical protein n=1 Tax=Bradyrhizobium centrolobii TaxID=1505087 RepID=UPI000AC7C342|nr:hypothetical protein [Bradyrhizobium centrolobii]